MYCFLASHGSSPHPPGLPGMITHINYLHSGSASGICPLRHIPLTTHFCPTMMILGCTLILTALALPFSCTSSSWCSFSLFNICTRWDKYRLHSSNLPSHSPPLTQRYILNSMKTTKEVEYYGKEYSMSLGLATLPNFLQIFSDFSWEPHIWHIA